MMRPGVEVDPITLSTVWHGLQSICREMRTLVQRSAQSHIIALLGDLSVGLWDGRGRTIAVPVGLPEQFLGGGLSVGYLLDDVGTDIEPGDVFLANDPYHGFNTHLPDWGFFRPIFYKNELLFWTLARGHQMDTGGAYPAGYFPDAYDIHAEGLCFPPIKVVSRGEDVKDIWKLIWNNVRYPDAMRTDISSLIAATSLAERRVRDVLDRYGRETVQACIESMIDRTERAIRQEIAKIPDGTYSGESATDDDGTELDVPVWVRCDITVHGDEMTIDFSRSDAQRRGFVNHGWGPTFSRAMALSFIFFDPALATYHNEGSMRPIKVVAPEGSVVNPRYPLPVGGSPISMGMQVAESVVMAMSKALPHRAMAGWGRRFGQYQFGTAPGTGEPYVWCPFDPDGGAGATWGFDGHQGPSSGTSALGNVQRSNVEEAEIRFPWHYLAYEFRPDSMGHGRWRGAPGMHWAVRNDGPRAGMPTGNGDGERTITPPAAGGLPGPHGRAWIERSGEHIPIHTHRMYWAEPGDVLVRLSGGGSGVGDPHARDPALVQEDVRNGLVSAAVAQEIYGLDDLQTASASQEGRA
jgi:N-methylhydantoinase B